MQLIDRCGLFTLAGDALNHYVEQLRVPDLTVGTYSIPAGGTDDHTPHTEDEVYVVCRGRARLAACDITADVEPGSVVYVPAGEPHRFVDMPEDLALLVVFAPAYRSRAR
jgi:mannose-6-phosphate isomerase-like protein (cupin superfamily)